MKPFRWGSEKNEVLKTVIPSRKATRDYLKQGDQDANQA